MFIVIKKNQIIATIVMIIVAVLLTFESGGTVLAATYFNQVSRRIPVYQVATEKKQVAITFDAAWGSDKTTEIMAVLKEYNASATFFLVGFWVEENKDLTKKIAENGFEIGTHSNLHLDMAKMKENAIDLDLQASIDSIKSASGVTPTLFRAPFGSYNNTLINVAEKKNLKTIQWTIDTLDWKGIKATEIASRVEAKLSSGSIILCHNNADNVVEATKLIMMLIQQRGYECVTVSDLLLKGETVIDSQGIQRQKS